MIAAAIERAATDTPEAAAVIHQGRHWTYADLHAEAQILADELSTHAGHRVALVVADFVRQLTALIALDRLQAQAFLYLASSPAIAEAAALSGLGFSAVYSDFEGIPAPTGPPLDAEAGVVLFTSGTSGPPKPVMHTWSSLAGAVRSDPSLHGRRWLLTYNPSGFAALQVMLQSLLTGGCLSVPGSREPALVSRAMIDQKVEFATGTPTFWRMLLHATPASELRQASLRQITLGGEVVTQDVLDALAQAFPTARISHVYASTEMGSCFAVHDGRAGFPAAFLNNDALPCKLRVAADGELTIQSKRSMLGNLQQTWNRGDWFPTGDLVEVSGDRCHFVGRKSDCINVGGAKVFPLEVETVIRAVPGVRDVLVKGRRSSIVGELVIADVVLDPATDPKTVRRDILSECRQRLARYKAPAIIEFKQRIVLTESNKAARGVE